jgi:hypothetical protein
MEGIFQFYSEIKKKTMYLKILQKRYFDINKLK